ncbi:MAG: leucine-rich repeat domain-containing protein [Clostridia bacterium]|nr:leucine-rich repeat domain-containing protein [Clostridia bacterium]
MTKKAVLTVLLLLLALGAALAEEPESGGPWLLDQWDALRFNNMEQVSALDLRVPSTVRYPVYSAPYEDSWRGAEGKARVSMADPFYQLAVTPDHEWRLIEYSTSGASRRIGWIHVACPEADDYSYEFCPVREKLRLTRDVTLTDDPRFSGRAIAELRAGDIVIGLLPAGERDAFGWIYAETQLEGKTVWGFLPADAAEDVPVWTLEDGVLTFEEGVAILGEWNPFSSRQYNKYGRDGADLSLPPVGSVTGRLSGPGLTEYPSLRALRLPDSLRYIGSESLSRITIGDLFLPNSSADFYQCFYGTNIGRVVIPAGFTGTLEPSDWDYTNVKAFEAEPGNPIYTTRDGVLFSGDGTVLIAYCNDSDSLAYQVPSGTLEIGASAFSHDSMDIPLQSITLPIGLRKIGAYAFSGCGRLQSLTVPLTVRELSEYAFVDCVSLERLSLPAHLQYLLEGMGGVDGVTDFTHYLGDNGEAIQTRDDDEEDEDEDSLGRYVWIDGEGPVPVYPDSRSGEVVAELAPGTCHWIGSVHQNGRWRAYVSPDVQEGWLDDSAILGYTGASLFHWADCGFENNPGLEFYEVNGCYANFYSEDDDRDLFLGDPSLSLFREHTGDRLRLGVLLAAAPQERILLRDAPGGAEAAHTYTGEQCEILAERDGWTQVRTARGTFWTETQSVREVAQAEE